MGQSFSTLEASAAAKNQNMQGKSLQRPLDVLACRSGSIQDADTTLGSNADSWKSKIQIWCSSAVKI